MRFVASSKPMIARSVTTRYMPPATRPLSVRLVPPRRKPGEVTKSTSATKRRFSCRIATIICVRLAISLPPPVPGQARDRMVGIADERTVEVAVLVDLRAAHEADVDVAPLQEQEHVGAAQDHVGT